MFYKGTVIEIHGRKAYVLNNMCEYQEILLKESVRPGDEIIYSSHDVCRQPRVPAFKRLVLVAASFALFLLFSFTAYQQITTRSVYAYLTLDINPSLEIGLNKYYKIVKAMGFNAEAKNLLKDNDILNLDLDSALSEIIEECAAQGYLQRNQSNTIAASLYFPDDIDKKDLLSYIRNHLSNLLVSNNLNAEIFYLRVDKKTWDEALQKNVSPMKYILWEQCKMNGLQITQPEEISLKDPLIRQLASGLATTVSQIGLPRDEPKSAGKDIDQASINNTMNNIPINSSPIKPPQSTEKDNKSVIESSASDINNGNQSTDKVAPDNAMGNTPINSAQTVEPHSPSSENNGTGISENNASANNQSQTLLGEQSGNTTGPTGNTGEQVSTPGEQPINSGGQNNVSGSVTSGGRK